VSIMQRKRIFRRFFSLHNFFKNNIETYVYLGQMEIKNPQKSQKNPQKFLCEKCNYITSNKKDYIKHCSTRKHKMQIMEINGNGENIPNQTSSYNCGQCGKNYATNAGLWKHSKKCTIILSGENANLVIKSDPDVYSDKPIENYIMKLVEQNNELKNMFIKQNIEFTQQNAELQEIKTILAEQPSQITNIQNNKTINNFNLNVFLQEKCKDALNMSDFIETLEINPQSVEYTGTHGYVNGITKIFMDGLNQLGVHERPIHCTDLKRETLYIKEEDKWEKDTEDKVRFKKALDKVVNRNISQVKHWEEENPRCKIPETDEYEFYFVIARQSLGGGDHVVTARNNDRITRMIVGKVYIDKKSKELI